MTYQKLAKLFYKLDPESFTEELHKRRNGYGSYLTSLFIKGFRKGHHTSESFELFYVNTHDLMSLNNEVLLNSSEISSLISKLPDFVVEPYFHKLIVNEAQSNNEIEGVRSTKKELQEALREVRKPEAKHKRFTGLVKTYLYIDHIKPFDKIQDFRSLYDQLVADENEAEDKPDGELFRRGRVEINDGQVTTHIGVGSEKDITASLGALIHYLKDESHPPLYRYMVAHYYYEYIHPFYDGNGRTGRLLVGSYLSRYLEKYSAITFSYAVNQDKSTYYRALEDIAFPLNQGEVTFYLIHMLELLSAGQRSIIDDLEISLLKLERIREYMKQDKWKGYGDAREILYSILTINVFITENHIVSVQDVMNYTNRSRHKINNAMDYLVQEGYVELVSKKPKSYQLCDGCMENIISS